MIFAELMGKLGTNHFHAHERAEDVLTSTVFGLLRYLPATEGFLAVLQRVQPVRFNEGKLRISHDDTWLGLMGVAAVRVDFWPWWGRWGQPDVLLTLVDATNKPVALVLVEAKLHAPKSGRAGAEDGNVAEADTPDPDQLVRYWQGLLELEAVRLGAAGHIVYLTKHGKPPAEELAESLGRKPDMRLGWLSWCDIFSVAHSLRRTSLPAADLALLLSHKGLKYFTGFSGSPWKVPSTMRFWKQKGWFPGTRPWVPHNCDPHFWGEGEQ